MIELDKANKENQHLRSEHQQASIKIAYLEEEIACLKEQLQLVQERQFGKKRIAEKQAKINLLWQCQLNYKLLLGMSEKRKSIVL